eukprot:500836_1
MSTNNKRVSKILDQLSKHQSQIIENKRLSSTCILLNDGTVIPQIGIGTWKPRMGMKSLIDRSKPRSQQQLLQDKKEDNEDYNEFSKALYYALKHGYKHIDTAQTYRTEKVVGDVVKNIELSDISRKNIWITTKVAQAIRKPEEVRASIEKSLHDLQTYIDLFLIHSPHTQCKQGERGKDVIGVYKILHEYKKLGKIRSVGVSNFSVDHLKTMERFGLELPSVNQIEVSCFLYEKELIEYCNEKGIVIEAYSPICKGDEKGVNPWNNKLLIELGKKYNKTWAQIMIKWVQQQGFVVLVKSTNVNRIIENGDIFDFKIDDNDMEKLKALSKQNIRVCWNPMQDAVWDI